ncbi:MAG: HAMP domain-containing protein [ANME-2 cluster archaeon]|nr:HAMP domain-containing protein [ANME-2 cluster archaeon]
MKIMYKIILGFLVVALISLATGLYTSNLVHLMENDITNVDDVKYPINQHATNYQRGANQLWLGTYIYANGDVAIGKQFIRNGKAMMTQSRESLSGLLDKNEIAELQAKENSAIASSDKVISTLEIHNKMKEMYGNHETMEAHENEIQFNLNLMQQRVSALNLALSSKVDESQEDMEATLNDAKGNGEQAIYLTQMSLFSSWILSIVIAVFISLIITRPLTKLTDVSNKISEGNLDVTLPEIKTKDEIYELNESMKGVLAAVELLTDVANEHNKGNE